MVIRDKLQLVARALRKVLRWCLVVVLAIGAYFLAEILVGGTPEDSRMQRRIIRG